MSDELCFLLLILHGDEIMKVSFKCKRDKLPPDAIEYYMEYRDKVRALLPEHIREVGPIIDMEPIFDVVVV